MQNPPKTEGGNRRPLAEDADVILHDTEEGIDIVVENRGNQQITLRFDFGDSQNLALKVPEGIQQVGEMRCTTVSEPSSALNLCQLFVKDPSQSGISMRYRVQCLVRGANGELVPMGPPGRPSQPRAAPSAASVEGEEVRPLAETLNLIVQPGPNHGYILVFESTDSDTWMVSLDFSKSENLDVAPSQGMKQVEKMRVNGEIERGGRVPFATLSVVDFSLGGCNLNYNANFRKDSTNRLAREEAAKHAAEEEAAKRKEEEAQQAAEAEAKAAEAAAAAANAEKRFAAKKALVEKEYTVLRLKLEAEWRAWWISIEKQWRENLCALCRKPHVSSVPIVEYKIYRLHKPCFDAAPKCSVCGDILIGEYVQTKGDTSGVKLHKECIEAYKKGTRPVCGDCGKQIMDQKWSTNAGVHYHTACRAQE